MVGRRADGSAPESPDRTTGWMELASEIERSRRSGAKFVLMRFRQERLQLVSGRRPRQRHDLHLTATLASHVRSVDRVWAHGRDRYVLAWNSDYERTQVLLNRIRENAPEVLEGQTITIACFPEDGLTFDVIVAVVERPHSIILDQSG